MVSSSFLREREENRAARARGFTLIEITVVMLVLAILLGLAALKLTRDDSDLLRDEAYRLVVSLQGAQQQAILEGKPYAFVLTDDGYEFFRPNDKGRLMAIDDDETLAPRKLSQHMRLGTREPASVSDRRAGMIVFEPSGEFNPFALVFKIGDVAWYVLGQADGQIYSSGQPSET